MIVGRSSYSGVLPWDALIEKGMEMSQSSKVAIDTSPVVQLVKSNAPLYLALGLGSLALIGGLAYVALKA